MNFYFAIVGDIGYSVGEDYDHEMTIERVDCIVANESLSEVTKTATALAEKLEVDCLVPRYFFGRIYNSTDQSLILSESTTIYPRSKIEWNPKEAY